ncbi:histidine kinase [Streptomyces sp. AS58]|uniref:histidine kinase n=1 Tax=Streptomyces cadmiisoli TaxID=2184053 RepID=A0A2Z4IRG6_9ACTN|nr:MULTISPECIES: HAMP domain-containing sensor histidine kinase [Streptomyces]AWW35415.1 sensor histidine kinase [Streptomyces cadmiisoli]AWW42024.1 sensor histidine kinase [Streptomyces cadmiisoli]KOV52567.1 histidine kinase [Streptomyces sp. AS58]
MGRAVARRNRGLSNWRSLRWKIAALVALASCAVATTVGVLVHRSTSERLMGLGRDRAFSALVSALDDYSRTGATPTDADPAQIPPALLQQAVSTGQHRTWYDDRRSEIPWMWAVQPVDGRILAVRVDMGSEMRSLQALDRNIVAASLAVLAVVVPLAVLAAELPHRRLRKVARTARRIADGDLEARTMVDGRGGDEITEISVTLDSMADALRDRLLSEQRFTADVAHELRTPLMGLVVSTDLLPDGEATALVRDRVQVLRELVEDLLEISRLDSGAERADRASVPLGRLVEESVARTGVQARLTVIGDPVADTDPRRLDRIISNLVSNAHRHGRAPVDVTVNGASIVVRDHGPGFPDELLAEGPQRFRTGAAERGQGHGLGLTIATGQARVIGAALAFTNAPEGGAIATLRLRSEIGPQG